MVSFITFLAFVAIVGAQGVGNFQQEVHPKLSWERCTSAGSCEKVQGEIVVDSNFRWIHNATGTRNCYAGNEWDRDLCPDAETCTASCVLEGIDYKGTYGITTNGSSLTQQFVTYHDFSNSVNSRVFLLEKEDKYQTFTLMNNELAFDIDLTSVECGINAAMYFVEMESDGGAVRFPTNKAGAKYGTGYCDATCARFNRFVGGKANSEGWIPSENDPVNGEGWHGACCSEFDIWNSNSHSHSTATKLCRDKGYSICDAPDCTPYEQDPIVPPLCDRLGCDYNPYRLDATEFYGKGKILDTTKVFTVVTRFEKSGVSRFFIQGGKKIETPAPAYPGFPNDNILSEEYCGVLPDTFGYRDLFNELGGFDAHNDVLSRPMVLTMAITNDHWGHNLWLDSIFPPEAEGQPGSVRGNCVPEDNDPEIVELLWPKAKSIWSNIRFGPIGSTVEV